MDLTLPALAMAALIILALLGAGVKAVQARLSDDSGKDDRENDRENGS